MEGTALQHFRIDNRVVVITGGAGLLGQKHAEAVLEGGGIPVLIDISSDAIDRALNRLKSMYGQERAIHGFVADITDRAELE